MWQHRLIFSDVDVIHAHDVFWWYLPLRLVKFRQSAYTTFHGYEGSGFPTNGAKIHRKLVEFLSKKTICVGEFMTKWYKAKPDKVIYGAASIKATPPPGNNSIAYIGGLAEDVGILVYLQALAKMAWKIPIHIYGDGDLRSEAERFAKKYELPVVFHGWVKDIDEVYSKHSVIFTSRYLGILEAMQAGRLVVAVYNNEIKKDYLECHPAAEYMIIAGGAKELCKKLSKLDMNTSREMMRKAYVWSRKQTWNILANEYLDLWEKLRKIAKGNYEDKRGSECFE